MPLEYARVSTDSQNLDRQLDALKKYGIDRVSVDCDGKIDKLVPIWLENGVNTMFPIEVGTWDASIAPWREKYGKELAGVLIGPYDASIMIDHNTGEIKFSCQVPNSEYKVNFDFTTVCRQREAVQRFIDDLAKEIVNGTIHEGALYRANIVFTIRSTEKGKFQSARIERMGLLYEFIPTY